MAEREQQIAKRLAAATPGPWGWFGTSCGCNFIKVYDGSQHGGKLVTSIDDSVNDADAELIANAPADLAHLLKELGKERRRKEFWIAQHGERAAELFTANTDLADLADLAAARAEVERLRGALEPLSQCMRPIPGGTGGPAGGFRCGVCVGCHVWAALARADGDGR